MKIHLKNVGNKKIAVIKEVRAATGLNLKDAKDLVDRAPVTFDVDREVNGETARYIVRAFQEAGATISVDLNVSVIDKLTAASYINVAQVAMGEGNITECRNALRSALRLIGDMPDDTHYFGAVDLR